MLAYVCVCVCVRPGEAGSAAKGKSWISHILTLPSSEQDISSLHQRPRYHLLYSQTLQNISFFF